MTSDPYHLERFVTAQDPVFEQVTRELRDGRKRTHWIWFIFPQLAGLGRSEISKHFSIADLDEARAYLAHPVLGPRLRQCTELVNAIDGRAIEEIFGDPDDLKFRSSMTLFASATHDNEPFVQALEKYFGGEQNEATLRLLNART